MPKYLCLQHSLVWRAKFRKNLVDLGGKLSAWRIAAPDPAPDGPFGILDGYMIVSADSLDEAVQVARECPRLVRPGSGVEVIEIHAPG